jgi:hypothetical protein
MRSQLTEKWSIDLDEEYERRVVEESLHLIARSASRTIWLAVWEPPEEQDPATVLASIKEDVNPDPDWFTEEEGADSGELRYASWYSEQGEREPQYALYAYTVRRGSYVQAAFISNDPADRDWAIATWRSLRYSPAHLAAASGAGG